MINDDGGGGRVSLETSATQEENVDAHLIQDIVITTETNPTPRKNPDNLLLHLAKPFIQPSSIELEITGSELTLEDDSGILRQQSGEGSGDTGDALGGAILLENDVSGNLVLDGDVPFTKQGEIVLEDGTEELRGYNNLLLEDNGSVDLELGTDIGDINLSLIHI